MQDAAAVVQAGAAGPADAQRPAMVEAEPSHASQPKGSMAALQLHVVGAVEQCQLGELDLASFQDFK